MTGNVTKGSARRPRRMRRSQTKKPHGRAPCGFSGRLPAPHVRFRRMASERESRPRLNPLRACMDRTVEGRARRATCQGVDHSIPPLISLSFRARRTSVGASAGRRDSITFSASFFARRALALRIAGVVAPGAGFRDWRPSEAGISIICPVAGTRGNRSRRLARLSAPSCLRRLARVIRRSVADPRRRPDVLFSLVVYCRIGHRARPPCLAGQPRVRAFVPHRVKVVDLTGWRHPALPQAGVSNSACSAETNGERHGHQARTSGRNPSFALLDSESASNEYND